MRKKGGAPQLDGWRRSSEWREIARRQCEKMNKQHREKPRCGAARKLDGNPCQKPALENGRCQWHGGKTPKGDQWHVTQWPGKTQKRAVQKMNRKLEDVERATAELKKRLSKMTEEELAVYEAWKKTHKPGKAAARELKRQDAKNAGYFRALSGSSKSENTTADAAELRARRLYLEAEYERLQQLLEDSENLGAFG